MKKNLILAGYNYARLRRLATQFAEIFDMRFFDIYDYFIFDNSPNSIADLYHQNGWEYVDEQVRDTVEMQTTFDNVVSVLDLKIASICTDFFDKIKENNVVVYIGHNEKTEEIRKRHIFYRSQEEMAYFLLTEEALERIQEKVKKELADIIVDDGELAYDQLRDKILDEFQKMVTE
jgi:RNase adaptor protein for sRNA GlmZ degradation